MPSFSCPNCKKVLKTSTPIPEGKKIKCPACAQVFAMPAAGEEKTAVTSKKPVSPARKPAAAAAIDPERTKPRRPDPDDEEETSRKSARKAHAQDEEEDADEDDDQDKKKKKKAGSKRTMILALGGGGALLLILLVAAFIWPGFLAGGGTKPVVQNAQPLQQKQKSQPRNVVQKAADEGPAVPESTGPVDLLTFVPNNSAFVAGFNLGPFLAQPGALQKLEQALKQMNGSSPAQLDLLKKLDRGIVAGDIPGPEKSVILALASKEPLDVNGVRAAFNTGPFETIEGKVIAKQPGPAIPPMFALPDNKTIVVSGTMPQPEFIILLDGKGQLPPPLQAKVAALNQKPIWAVINLQVALKDVMDPAALKDLPGGPEAFPAIKNATTGSLFLDYDKNARLQLDVECANEEEAGLIEAFAKKAWEEKGKPVLGALPLLVGKQPGAEALPKLVEEISKTFAIQKQGSIVTVSVTISENTLLELQKFQPQMNSPAPPKKNTKKK